MTSMIRVIMKHCLILPDLGLLTCFTSQSDPSSKTVACKRIDSIHTLTTVQTWVGSAVINIYEIEKKALCHGMNNVILMAS